ncbi:hypothetical protein [Fodinicola acaciae]|uniref:hypothetical protein n=1 Tax=Fodinicola acaciae TaxID=2681555 RepID=UPI0013D1CF9A|nr:hypothetical protein [Fodinicola acaciae]
MDSPPSLRAARPLTEPPARVAGTIAARIAAGLAPVGRDHPRRRRWIGLAGATLVAALAASLVLGWYAVLLAFAATVAVFHYVRTDPLRLSASQCGAYVASTSWQSEQPWNARNCAGPQRRLVAVACDAVDRIVSSRSWPTPALDEHRLRLDLAAELTDIDRRAYLLTETSLPPALEALEARVAALACYADELAVADRKLAVRPENPEAELLAGAVRDAYATGQLTELTEELRGLSDAD